MHNRADYCLLDIRDCARIFGIFEGSHNFILHLISLEEHRPRLFVDLCIIKLPILPSHDQVTVTDPDDRDRSDSH